jgi:glycerophosphoryl diester phosphodiesterase
MKYPLLLLYLLLTIACYKTDHNIVNLNGNKIEALGHAGMGIKSAYPINSFESIAKALALGADGTEMDVQLSADGVLVAFHDQNLESSTNKEGIINDLTWAEIEGAYYTNIPFHDYKVVKLESILSKINNIGQYRLALDCKLYSANSDSLFFQQYASELIRLLDFYQMPGKTIIESSDPKLLDILKAKGARYQLFWYTNNIKTSLEEAENWPIDGFTLRDDQASAEDILAAHGKGYFIALYNTQSKSENIEAIEKNPDFIQSDELRHLLKVMSE